MFRLWNITVGLGHHTKMKTPGSCFEREGLIITLNRQDTLNHAGALRGNHEELLR